MPQKMFSVYDSKATGFLPPFLAPNADTAIRMIVRASHDDQSNFALFAADYTLFELGDWDEDEGKLFHYEAHENLGTVLVILDTHTKPLAPVKEIA